MARAPSKPPAATTAPKLKKSQLGQASQAQVELQRVTTGNTVTVACKMPAGFNLGRIHGEDKPEVILRGSGHVHAVGGYGLTPGIDKDAFAKWVDDHKWHAAVKNELIFASDKGSTTRVMAAERAGIETGMEPLDADRPGGDPRVSADIEPTDDQKKENERIRSEAEERAEFERETNTSDV